MTLDTELETANRPSRDKFPNDSGHPPLTNQNQRGPTERDWFELDATIRQGNVTQVKEWFKSRGLTNAKQFWSVNLYWPLQTAVRVGNLEIFETVVRFGFDPKEETFYGEGLVHTAARAGHSHVLERLREYGLSLSVRDEDDNMPLHSASAREIDNTEVITYLAKNANDINAKNTFHETPLQIAVRRGSPQNVRSLVKLRADINVVNINGFSLLHSAINRQNDVYDVVNVLCNAGTIPKGPIEFRAATKCRNAHVISLFVERNFIINGGDASSKSPLANLARIPDPFERTRLIDVLLTAGYDIRADIPWIRNFDLDSVKVRDVNTLQRQLVYYTSNPLSLVKLSCITIRNRLGTSLPYSVADLPLPETLKDVIRLKHVLV